MGSELIRLGSSFVTSGRVLVNLGRFQVRLLGRLKVHSDFGFQHALFVGDMT